MRPVSSSASWLDRPAPHRWLRSPLLWLLVWGMVGFAGRVAISPAVMWDQAEQLVWSQELALGYGPQPPLYTWIQWGVNQVFGPTALALALLKFTLMVLTFWFMAQAARQLMPESTAWLVAISLWWLPGFEWQVLRDLTHTVLLTCLVAASWWLLLRQIRQPDRAGFVWLGLVMGLGMLSKYSYLLVIVATVGAALSLPAPRRALLSRGWWLAPLVGFLVVAPHASWVLTHWHEASSATLDKMYGDPEVSTLAGMVNGLWDIFRLSLAGAVPFALVVWWAFGKRAWRDTHPPAPNDAPALPWAAPFWRRYFAIIYVGLLSMVFLVGTTNFEGRWLHPLLCVVPLTAFSLRPWLGQQRRGVRRSAGAALLMAVILSVGVLLDCWVDARLRNRADRFNWDIEGMATTLRAAGYDGQAPIVASHHTGAGNLRIVFPKAQVSYCNFILSTAPACVRTAVDKAVQDGTGVLVVAVERPVPDAWWAGAQTIGANVTTVRQTGVPLRWARADAEPLTLHFYWQPPAR
ncbi:ArnT family glycosyltransferase [Ottowia sp.]|uniref:ArnT family glycosyltransferase n=1 Tax=Ottowia sp. TaxID=1898956 RepID=UPI003A8B7A43